MNQSKKVAIAGLGTVGCGVIEILQTSQDMLSARAGCEIQLAAVSAQNRTKERAVDISNLRWIDDPLAMATDPDIDIVVELIGGADGVARQLVEQSLKAGKSVVTANKALIAHHGVALASLAEASGAVLAFEAAVAGGIPVIKTLREGLAANHIGMIAGILNGTCNYILTTMLEEKRQFDEVLAEAQALGYAEAEPSFDIDGIDTAHKLAILASLAYGCAPSIDHMHVEGIRHLTLRDMECAWELGYVIKLLGIANHTEHGVQQRVYPCLIEKDSPLGAVHGVYNAVMIEGDAVETVFLEGQGAGAGPTASSVIADIIDIVHGVTYHPLRLPVDTLTQVPVSNMDNLTCSYYLRLSVEDQPGVLAEITGTFKNQGISFKSVLQPSPKSGEAAELILTTHETTEQSMKTALEAVMQLEAVKDQSYMIRIENL